MRKAPGMKTFGENICNLILCSEVTNRKIFTWHVLPNKMVVDPYVLGASMKDRIRGKRDRRNIITPNGGASRKENMEILKQKTKP